MELDPTRDYYPDIRHTVNVEEAIALMIGWMREPVKPTTIPITTNGIPDNELSGIFEINDSVGKMLLEQRIHALNEYSKAVDSDQPEEQQHILAEKIGEKEALLEKASVYGIGIKTELTNVENGKPSLLVIDQQASKLNGEPHITKLSLRDWALSEHQIDILPSLSGLKDDPPSKHKADQPEADMTDTNNIYLTIHLLVEAISATKVNFRKDQGPNHLAIANTILDTYNFCSECKKCCINKDHTKYWKHINLPRESTFTKSFKKGRDATKGSLPTKMKLSSTSRPHRLDVIAFLIQALKKFSVTDNDKAERTEALSSYETEDDIARHLLKSSRSDIGTLPSLGTLTKLLKEAEPLYVKPASEK